MDFTIVTGMSGAGRSQALKRLEDLGFFCVDNMPPSMLPEFAALCLVNADIQKAAAVVDLRMGEMFDNVYDAINKLNEMQDIKLSILYLDASDEALVKRFKETRRRHPMAQNGNILTGITKERGKLKRIYDLSNIKVDTSTFSLKKLGDVMEELFSSSDEVGLLITVTTFGYKRGIPIDAAPFT